MEPNELSHRNSKSKFVRVDLTNRETNSRAIVTCDKNALADCVERYQALGYQLTNVRET